ncbi:MAG: NAD(P)-dependent alcohol dehydrogenase [Rhodospirillaceae bacterium]|nr:NAD(P)-dependent alcohol dehydrogenase [Rhodospirillaceae bacterium]
MKVWQIVGDGGIDALEMTEWPSPEPGPGQVKVRVRANSINYRDLNAVRAPGRMGLAFPRIPNSDGAGDVVAVGAGVSGIGVGDRVAGCFFQNWAAGDISAAAMASALGGPIDGMLAEEVVLNAHGVVPVPAHLDYAEAATLPCAALTAWNGLAVSGGLKAGDTVLLLGTGGVSIFALQFCAMTGAQAIITSKSDDKLARARKMGAWRTINYAETPDWASAVNDMTGGAGVDHVVEVGGGGTLEQSIEAVRVGGHIAMIGVLTQGAVNPTPILRKSIRLHGIYVGSRAMFLDMNAAIEAGGLKPVIDRRFAFADAPDTYRCMEAAGHFGKIVIEF